MARRSTSCREAPLSRNTLASAPAGGARAGEAGAAGGRAQAGRLRCQPWCAKGDASAAAGDARAAVSAGSRRAAGGQGLRSAHLCLDPTASRPPRCWWRGSWRPGWAGPGPPAAP
jgi:hypothetical protein